MEYNYGTGKRVPVNVCTATEIHRKREMASGGTGKLVAMNAVELGTVQQKRCGTRNNVLVSVARFPI